jgi:hypothetical protein
MFFGLFSSKVDRLKKQVRERYGQHDVRHDAMARLLQMETEESYRAVVSRFGVNCDSPTYDEQEKTWLADRLSARGEDPALLLVLEEAIMTGDRLNQVLAVAARLMPAATYKARLKLAFERRLGDHRGVDACVELVHALGALGGEAATQAAIAAAADRSDEVVLAGIAVLADLDSSVAAAALYGIAFDPLQMPRVVRRAGQAIAGRGFFDPESREVVPEILAEDFSLEGGRLISRT